MAFTNSEPIGNGFVMAAFTKTDIKYRGSSQYVDQKRAEYFYNLGYKFLNNGGLSDILSREPTY